MADRVFEATFWDDPDHLDRVMDAERFGEEAYLEGRSSEAFFRIRAMADIWVRDAFKRGWRRAKALSWVDRRGGYG